MAAKVWRFDPLQIDGDVEDVDAFGIPLAEEITPDSPVQRLRFLNRSRTKFAQSIIISLLLFAFWTGGLILIGIAEAQDPWWAKDVIIYVLASGMAGVWLWSVILAKIFGRL